MYESWEKHMYIQMYVPVFGEKRYTIQKKGVWLGATRMDGMQSGEGGKVLFAAIQTLRGVSKPTCTFVCGPK